MKTPRDIIENGIDQFEAEIEDLNNKLSKSNSDNVLLKYELRQALYALDECIHSGKREMVADAPGIAPDWYDAACKAFESGSKAL